jgi:hypothetical protein
MSLENKRGCKGTHGGHFFFLSYLTKLKASKIPSSTVLTTTNSKEKSGRGLSLGVVYTPTATHSQYNHNPITDNDHGYWYWELNRRLP